MLRVLTQSKKSYLCRLTYMTSLVLYKMFWMPLPAEGSQSWHLDSVTACIRGDGLPSMAVCHCMQQETRRSIKYRREHGSMQQKSQAFSRWLSDVARMTPDSLEV